MSTIHELMHVAIKGTVKIGVWSFATGMDTDYADAVADLAGDPRPIYIPENAVVYRELQLNGNAIPSHILIYQNKEMAASKYWGQRLNQACGYNSHITHKPTFFRLYKEGNK